MPLKGPSKATVKKYGLTINEWWEIAKRQGEVCYICKRLPKREFLCVDHEHVKGFKKMSPECKRIYVRGLLCSFCNLRVLHKGATLERLEMAVLYLREYNQRKAQAYPFALTPK
jgi:hypothetical protein